MARENKRPVAAELANELADFDRLARVESVGGFVENKDLGVADKRLREADALEETL